MATTFAESGVGDDAVNRSTYTTGTVVASEGDWVVIGVHFTKAGAVPAVTGISGSALGSMTYVDHAQNPGSGIRLEVWKAKVGAGGISETLSIALDGTAEKAAWHPIIISGAHATDVIEGTNYDDDSNDSASSLQCVLSSFQSGGSVLAFGCAYNNGATIGFEGAYTEGTEISSSESLEASVGWLVGTEDTAVDVTFGGSYGVCAVAMEVATAAAAGSGLLLQTMMKG